MILDIYNIQDSMVEFDDVDNERLRIPNVPASGWPVDVCHECLCMKVYNVWKRGKR